MKQISEFLGKSFSDEILDAITDHCSFESMKKNPMTNPDSLIKNFYPDGKIPDGQSFLRKGTNKLFLFKTKRKQQNIGLR